LNRPITCLHLADIHFGVEAYGFTNPATGLNTRLEDFSASLEQAIDRALSEPVDLVLFAGDAYKRNNPSPTEQRELVKHFCRLADAGIPTVMISGNHDIPVMHGKASSIDIFRRLRPGMIHICVNQPTVGDNPPFVVKTKNGPIAVCCLPYLSPSFLRNVEPYKDLKSEELHIACQEYYHDVITAMPERIPSETPRILLAHLSLHGALLGGYRGSLLMSEEVQLPPMELASAGYDYVALGHIHRYQNLSPMPNVPVVYPGSIDRVDFGEAEESKGFVIARIQRGGSEHEFVSVSVRPFRSIHVECDPGADSTETILSAIAREEMARAVVRLSYVADDAEAQTLDMKRIQEALRPAHFKAGFYRIPRESALKRRSSTLSREATLADALAAYLQEHEEWKDEGPALLEKAKDIAAAAQDSL